jgi:sortase (surface protein transpeptidase)
MPSFFDTSNQVDFAGGAKIGALLGSVAVAADELAIPVTHRHVQKTTGGDAEALTLANGVPGQRITINLAVDGGGTGTLVPTTKTGFTGVALADAGDKVTLEYVDDTVGWIVDGTSGVSAPPSVTIA